MTRVLVGTLHCGEPQYEACVRSIEAQSGVDVERFTIADLPNKEAHDALYRTFMQRSKEFDFFLKLDADMELMRRTSLLDMIERMEAAELDRIMIDVMDEPSGLLLPGVQMFRSTCVWPHNPDPMMVDHLPVHGGPARRDFFEPTVAHMVAFDEWQGFRYGLHKALKALQPDRAQKNIGKALLHWAVLKAIYRRWRAKDDLPRMLAILAAEEVFSGQHRWLLDPKEGYAGPRARALFERTRMRALTESQMRFWDHETLNDGRWLQNLQAAPWPKC